MNLSSLFFLILISLGWSTPIYADWKFEGLVPMVQKKLNETLAYKNLEVTAENADKIIGALHKSPTVRTVEARLISPGNILISIQLFEQIYDVRIEGNRRVSSSSIRDAAGLVAGDRFAKRRLVEAGEAIKKLYSERGHLNADVKVEYKNLGNNQMLVVYKISESRATSIGQIIFQSENPDLNRRLQNKLKHILGEPLTQANVQVIEKEMNEFLHKERYVVARLSQPEIIYSPDRTEAKITFKITEPFFYEFIFSGNKRYSDSDLRRIVGLNDMELVVSDPLTEFQQKIKDKYLEEGFAHIQVDSRQDGVQDKFMRRIRMTIDEGARVKITGFEIEGRITRPVAYYSDILKNQSSELIEDGYYNRTDLENGFKNLVTDLNNKGYLRAKVASSRLEYSMDRSRAKVFVNIEEGPLTQVKRIQFSGATKFPTQALVEQISLRTNSPLRLNELETSLENLKNFYLTQGYLEMKVSNEGTDSLVQYNENGTQATINFQIFEGPQIKVASIVINGNTFTKHEVILREIDFRVGDTLTTERLTNSRSRLNRTGLFGQSNIQTLEQGTNVSERTVVITIAERNPGLVRFGVGANNDNGLTAKGYTAVTYSNLWGTARAISGRMELQENIDKYQELEQKYSIGYLEPYIFESRTRGRVNYSFSKEVVPDSPADDKVIGFTQRADLLLERDLTEKTKLTWTFWSIDVYNETQGGQSTSQQQVAQIGPALDIDYRDSPFLPTRGQYLRLSTQYSNPSLGSSKTIHFSKSEASYSFYFPFFNKKLVWANNVRAGYLKNFDRDGSGVPSRYAFYLGGYSTIRGYGGIDGVERIPNETELPTNDSYLTQIIDTESTMYLGKTEIRFPIYDPLGGVVFYDVGEVQVLGQKFQKPIHQSLGFGIRINTELGPIVLDYARKIDPQCYVSSGDRQCEREDRLHFSIGTF